MQHDDVALLETFLGEVVEGLTPALRSAELALEILGALRRSGQSIDRPDLVPPNLIDDDRFSVRWNGGVCHLGATILYRLFRSLARSANHYLTVERLMEEAWPGPRSDAAVRSAVRSLRRKLERAGMAELARCIRGQPGHYGLLLDGIGGSDGSHGDLTTISPRAHRPSP